MLENEVTPEVIDLSGDDDVSEDTEEVSPAAHQLSRESDDTEAALAILRELRGKSKPAEPAKPEAKPAVAVTPTAAVPVIPAEPAKVEDDGAKIVARLNNMERQLRAAEARTKELADKAAKADMYDRLAQDGNLPALAEKFGWSPEAILKYVDEGPAAFKPSKVEAKIDSVHQELQATKNALAQRDAEAAINTYKSSISRDVPGLKETSPYLLNMFTDPESGVLDAQGVADRIFAVQASLHNDADDPRDITVAEAAQLLNAELEGQYKRLHGKQPIAVVPPAATPASKVVTPRPSSESPNVTPKPRISRKASTVVSQIELEEADQEEALAIIRSARRNKAASQ